MTSVEYLQLLLAGRRLPGHFTMPLIKQFCSMQTNRKYGQYSQDYRVLTQCQLELNQRHPIDAFNVLGYPYREANDCGMAVDFPEDAQPIGHGPLIHGSEDVERFDWPDPQEGPLMSDRIAAIARFKRERPDIVAMGALESPLALAATLVGLEPIMLALYDDPAFVERLLRRLEPLAIAFAVAQIDEGADLNFMGDAIASQIGPDHYVEHALPAEKRVIEAVQQRGVAVRLHICGDITPILEHVAGTGARMIDIDSAVDLGMACAHIGERSPDSFVVGNFNPVTVLLQGSPDDVRAACRHCERRAAGFDRFILSPGCEVPPATPLDNYLAMLEFGWKATA